MNTPESDAILRRRELVAGLWSVGASVRQICEALEKKGFVNPETRQPYSHVTIWSDVKALRRAVKLRGEKTLDAYRADQLLQADGVFRSAMAAGQYSAALGALKRKAELLGLDVPQKLEIDVRVLKAAEQLEKLGISAGDALEAFLQAATAQKGG